MMATQQRHLIIAHGRAPGDIVALTAFVRDLHVSRPGMFVTDVKTTSAELWDNNPYITRFQHSPPKGVEYWQADYGQGIIQSEYETCHFISWFHRDFMQKFKIHIPLTLPYPDLHLSETEKSHRPIDRPYWLCFPGGKTDFTAKLWGADNWVGLVDRLAKNGIQCVQAGSNNTKGKVKHTNPEIPGIALNLVGQSTLRETLQLIYHSEGVICHNSFPAHVCAALQKPCVMVAGGRESWWWFGYVKENTGLGSVELRKHIRIPHRVLHTIGQLDCCLHHGCQKCGVLPDGSDRPLCQKPHLVPGDTRAWCMQLITPAMVETAVLSYYLDGSIPTRPGLSIRAIND